MKKFKNRKILICAAVLLTMIVSTQTAMAYFSDYEHAIGQAEINLSGQTVIEEEYTDNSKTIKVQNILDAENHIGADAIVRVGIYGPEKMTVTPETPSDWKQIGDFYYYTKVLPAGSETSAITASIENVPVNVDNAELEIIVVHESAPIVYDNNGTIIIPESWEYAPEVK